MLDVVFEICSLFIEFLMNSITNISLVVSCLYE